MPLMAPVGWLRSKNEEDSAIPLPVLTVPENEAKKYKGIYTDTSHIDTSTCGPSPRGVSGAHVFVSLRFVSI